ncbi:MAG: 16S rRNA (adenine(1518)-N(6)/adenine(1519)-N(6))-dimethyltransferase RsmA [Acidobacteriota bacterium]
MVRPAYRKRFGQHHLVSVDLCRPLFEFLQPADWPVVEIGPGGGVLTGGLLDAGARVLALEVDLDWAAYLRCRLPAAQLVAMDALAFPWGRLREPTLVAGNLPFNVGTRIIGDLLVAASARPDLLPRLGFMVQKEVADRLTAAPGDGAYGALSVLVAASARARRLGNVAPGSFRPPPKVAAAFVGLEPRPAPLDAADMVAFRSTVHLAFGQRRKTLRNALAAGVGRGRAEAALTTAGIDPRRRAETVDLEGFLALHAALG